DAEASRRASEVETAAAELEGDAARENARLRGEVGVITPRESDIIEPGRFHVGGPPRGPDPASAPSDTSSPSASPRCLRVPSCRRGRRRSSRRPRYVVGWYWS